MGSAASTEMKTSLKEASVESLQELASTLDIASKEKLAAALKATGSHTAGATIEEGKMGWYVLPSGETLLPKQALSAGIAPEHIEIFQAWKPNAEPIEYETGVAKGSSPDTAIIVLHGLGMQGKQLHEGELFPGWIDEGYNSESYFEKAGVKKARIVLPSSPLCKDPTLLQTLAALTGKDPTQPKPSWFRFMKDQNDPDDNFKDWQDPELVAGLAYVHSLIRKEISRGIAPDRVFVLCHSQGGVLGSRGALTFPDAALGGLIMLDAFHASGDIETATHAKQKQLKIFAAHSPEDKIVPFEPACKSHELLKAAVGAENYNGGEGMIRAAVSDSEPPVFHCPFHASVAPKLGAFINIP